jgi:Rod binding domain-containing protein
MSFSTAPVDQALLPASVRSGTPAQQNAYTTGLAFEQMLVEQLSKELAATAQPTSDSTDGTDSSDGTDASAGLMGGGTDPASSTYAQLLPSALSAGLMSAGGLGVAQQLSGALEPSQEPKQ